jgi:hypothetical protein
MKLARSICVAGLLAWCVYVILYPQWVGCFYNQYEPGSTTWFPGGVFGLQDASGFTKQAPIWEPPSPHAEVIHAAVRWPWQSPFQHEHIEIVLSSVVMRIAFGIIVTGATLRTLALLFDRHRPGLLTSMAWSLAVALSIAWAALFGLAILTSGYAVNGLVIGIALSVAFVIGLVGGVAHDRRMRRRWVAMQANSALQPS